MVEKRRNVRFLALSALLGALLAILCPWTIPIGSVGITLATFLLMTLALSVRLPLALMAVALYLTLGALGLPVFSHFTGGIAQFLSPSGGFLIGYLPFVAITALSQYAKKTWVTVVSLVASHIVLYVIGAALFASVGEVSLNEALVLSVLPFLLPDAIKAVLAFYAARLLRRRLPIL